MFGSEPGHSGGCDVVFGTVSDEGSAMVYYSCERLGCSFETTGGLSVSLRFLYR